MEWLNLYENAIKNKNIIYLNELSLEEKENLKEKYGLKNNSGEDSPKK